MYKGFDSLLSIVITELKIELITNTYVLFVNSERNRLKVLFFDHGNIAIFAMRLAGSITANFGEVAELNNNSFYELVKNIKTKKPRSARYVFKC